LKEFMGWFGEFSGARAEINELIDAGDQVLVGITARGRGKQSGVESPFGGLMLSDTGHSGMS
jgi:hypothetical protein